MTDSSDCMYLRTNNVLMSLIIISVLIAQASMSVRAELSINIG